MGPGVRHLNAFSVVMESLDLLLMIWHTSKWPNPKGTILVIITEPEQNYVDERSELFGLE